MYYADVRVAPVLLMAGFLFATAGRAQLTFTDVAISAGVTLPDDSNRSAVVDVDGDGLEDLVLVGSSVLAGRTVVLYHNNGDGTFTDTTSDWPGLRPPSPLNADFTSWADFDNDGDPDVAMGITGADLAELRFLRNNRIGGGSQSFTLLASETVSKTGPSPGIFSAAAWADYDNDGDLDVFVDSQGSTQAGQADAPRLLQNQVYPTGSVSFTDVSSAVDLSSVDSTVDAALWIDADNDGDVDLFVVNGRLGQHATETRDLFYRNLLTETNTARFEQVAATLGLPNTPGLPSGDAVFGDYDNDADQDLYVTLGIFQANQLYRNNLELSSLSFTEVTASVGLQDPIDSGAQADWGDLDNDGDLELFAAVGGVNNPPSVLYRNQLIETGLVSFTDITSPAGLSGLRSTSALFFFDMENDGDLDLFLGRNNLGSNRLLRNDLNQGNWLELHLVGTDSNRDGIGARITLTAGGRDQHRQRGFFSGIRAGSRSQRIHFGLGMATTEELLVHWPSGCVQAFTNVPANQVFEVVENCRAHFLVIDEDSIDNGNPPNFFLGVDVNDNIADIGLRTPLPAFAGANVGTVITLHTGEVGDEGWFALKTIPDSWTTAGPTNDGLRNYVGNPSQPSPHNVGPGLGSGDDPEALLDKIPDVTPLRATGLKMLEGQRVCAVVYDSDISINYDPLNGSLKGANLGPVGFEVVSVTKLEGFSSSSLPKVYIEILDAEEVCEGELELFEDAPEPISSSEPFDVEL